LFGIYQPPVAQSVMLVIKLAYAFGNASYCDKRKKSLLHKELAASIEVES
jgi:hypothetical protein